MNVRLMLSALAALETSALCTNFHEDHGHEDHERPVLQFDLLAEDEQLRVVWNAYDQGVIDDAALFESQIETRFRELIIDALRTGDFVRHGELCKEALILYAGPIIERECADRGETIGSLL